ncbi:high-affinity nickel-transport family protein [Klebsormidium nitens]|uniref:High-affinity nickel-transport family protein n=1 Tax=Klebsormidium nitens TaxID=105231 RepID=A0A1Y1IC07_KLENI|nr:high-affinity nickel-transport family protein [Klebsormidium nitens]|eukprot:GAQ86959.1 high-affinity nickel-transport family protein [Klebsormidium nitens]
MSTTPQTGPSPIQSFHPLIQTAWTGLVTGVLHTMTGPDHLASLAPLTIGRSRVQSALLGALWGAGHGTGQLLLGSIFLLFKENIEHLLPLLSRWSGTLVGLILVLIGAHGLHESLLPIDGEAMEFTSYIGTYINGFTFGLQPDALMMILPALALPSRAAAASFLGAFLLGTIAAMATYAAGIGAASEALGKRMPWLTQRLSQISGIVAILLGLFFVVTNVLGL